MKHKNKIIDKTKEVNKEAIEEADKFVNLIFESKVNHQDSKEEQHKCSYMDQMKNLY